MTAPAMPLRFRPDRRYPATLARQASIDDEHDVCSHCVSGACCTTEGAIALTAFDVLRLAAFFDISPGAFLETFTQDRFVDPEGQARYTTWIESDGSSIVTFLRRRSLAAASPCLFLKYVHDDDGTPRRICSVHPARPLACREYYYDTCKKRSTGEAALTLADGYEAVRDGALTAADVAAQLVELGAPRADDGLARLWRRAFWSEMRRVLDIERANAEGAADPGLEALQDPIDAKLDRLLSSRYLRFEEKYGAEPHSEQLHAYAAGRSFRDSPDRERLLRIVSTPPAHGLYAVDADYPYHIGLRSLLPGVGLPQRFGTVALAPALRRDAVASAIARGWTTLLGVASLSEWHGGLMELEARDALDVALLDAVQRFPRAQQRRIGVVLPPLAQRWLVRRVAVSLATTLNALAARPATVDAWVALCDHAQRFDAPSTPRELAHVVDAVRAAASRVWSTESVDAELRRWQRGRALRDEAARDRRLLQLQRLCAFAWTASSRRRAAIVAALAAGLDGTAATAALRLPLIESLAMRVALPDAARATLAAVAARAAAALAADDAWPFALRRRWPRLALRLGLAADAAVGLAAARAVDAFDPPLGELPDWQDRYVLAIVDDSAAALEVLQSKNGRHVLRNPA